jgi:CHAT domain-containing protein
MAVDAASTTDLMIALHQQMRAAEERDSGHDLHPAESLRRAALGVMRDARYRHPYYWAGFLVVGRP